MHKEGAMGTQPTSLLRPRTPIGHVLLAASAALWAALLIVAWAPEPETDGADPAAGASSGSSAWLALATVGVIVVAGALHVRRHR